MWAAPSENVSSGSCGQQRSRSAYTSSQSDQSPYCPLTQSLNTTECMNGEERPGCYFGYAHDDLNLYIFQMFKDTLSLDAAHMVVVWHFQQYNCGTMFVNL